MFEWFNGRAGVKCNDMVHAEKAGVSRNGKVPFRESWPELDATTTRVPPLYWHYTALPALHRSPEVLSSLSLLTQLTRLPRSLYHRHVLYCAVVARSRVLNALLTVDTRHLTVDHEVLHRRSRAFKTCRADNIPNNGHHRVHAENTLWRVEQLPCATTKLCEEPSKWYVTISSTLPVQSSPVV
jgi:hypothetical protein